MNQMSICVNVQSFTDLITNSSMEVYIVSSETTLNTIRNIVDSLLKFGGSQYKANDLFEFKLDAPSYWDDNDFYDFCREYVIENILGEGHQEYICNLEEEIRKEKDNRTDRWHQTEKEKELNKEIENLVEPYITDELRDKLGPQFEKNNYDLNFDRGYLIIPKIQNEEVKKIAGFLSNLDDLFYLNPVSNY